jgi:hypothetical protein
MDVFLVMKLVTHIQVIIALTLERNPVERLMLAITPIIQIVKQLSGPKILKRDIQLIPFVAATAGG